MLIVQVPNSRSIEQLRVLGHVVRTTDPKRIELGFRHKSEESNAQSALKRMPQGYVVINRREDDWEA